MCRDYAGNNRCQVAQVSKKCISDRPGLRPGPALISRPRPSSPRSRPKPHHPDRDLSTLLSCPPDLPTLPTPPVLSQPRPRPPSPQSPDRSARVVAASKCPAGCHSAGAERRTTSPPPGHRIPEVIAKTAVYISFRCISRDRRTAPVPRAARRQAPDPDVTRRHETRRDETRRDEMRRDQTRRDDSRRGAWQQSRGVREQNVTYCRDCRDRGQLCIPGRRS